MRGVAAFLLSTLKATVGQPLSETPAVLNSFGPQLVLVVRTDSLSNAFLASDGKHSIWCIVTSEALAQVREEFPLIENTAGMRGFTVCIEKFRYSTPWRYLAQQRGPITTSRICIVVTELSVIDATSIHVPETPNVLNDHEIINIINQLTLAELEGRLYRKLSNPPPHAYQFNENNKLRISDCIIPPDQLKKLSSASAIVVPQSVLGTRRQADTSPTTTINAPSTNKESNMTTMAPGVSSSPTNEDSIPNPQSAPVATGAISSQTNPDFPNEASLVSNGNDAGTQETHKEAPYSQPTACASQPIETNFIPTNTGNECVSQASANAVLKHKPEVRLAKLPRTPQAPILPKISAPTITTQAGTSIMRPVMPIKAKKPRKIAKNMLPIRPVRAKDFKASAVDVATKMIHTSNVQPVKERLPKKPSTDSTKAPKTTPQIQIVPPNDKTVSMTPPSQVLTQPAYTSPKKTTNPSEDYFNAISPILPVKQHLSTLELVSMVPSDISTSGSSSPTASTLALTRARLVMPPSSPETQSSEVETQNHSTPQNATMIYPSEEDSTMPSNPSSMAVPEKPRANEQAEDLTMVEKQPSPLVHHQPSNTTPVESQPSGLSQPSSATKANVETSGGVQSAVATSSSGMEKTPVDVIDISEDPPSGQTNECIDLTSDDIVVDDDEVVITQVVQSQILDESPDFYILPSQPELPRKTSTREKASQVKIPEPPKPDTIVLTGDDSELTQMPLTQDFVAPFDQFDGILTQAFDSQETESSHDSQATISSCESGTGNSKDRDLFSMPVPATQLPDTDDGIAYETSTIPPEPEPQLLEAASPEITSVPTKISSNFDAENDRELFNLPIPATQPQDTDDGFAFEPNQMRSQTQTPVLPIKLATAPNLNLVAGKKTPNKTLMEAALEIHALLSTATKAANSNSSKKTNSLSPQATAVHTNANVLPASKSRTIPAIVSPQLSYATKKFADGSPEKLLSTNSSASPHSTPPKPASQSTKNVMIASSPSVERLHLETRKSILSPTLGNQTAIKAGLPLSTTTALSTRLPPKTSSQVCDSSIIASQAPQNTPLAEYGTVEKSIPFDEATIAASSPVISQIEQTLSQTIGDTLAPVVEPPTTIPESHSPQTIIPLEQNNALIQASSQNVEVPKHQPVEVTPPSKGVPNSNDEHSNSIAPTEHFSKEGIVSVSGAERSNSGAERSNIPIDSVPSSIVVGKTGKAQASVPTSSVSSPQKEVPILHTISTTPRNEANAGHVNENTSRTAVVESSIVGANTNMTQANVNPTMDGVQSCSSTGSEAAPSTATLSSDPLNRYPVKFFRYSWTNASFSIFPIPRSKADFDHELRSHYLPSAKRLCLEPRDN